MKPEKKEQKRQFKAMRLLERACRYGSMRNKLAARCAMRSELTPVDAWKLFKETTDF